jgi:hypothetical protein
MGLIASGVALYQVRAVRPEVSRDYDVFFSSLGLLCGGILVFQGWRLDPLLFFGQLLTAGSAVSFAVEAVRLRSEVNEARAAKAPPPTQQQQRSRGGGAARRQAARGLPPPGGAARYAPWTGANEDGNEDNEDMDEDNEDTDEDTWRRFRAGDAEGWQQAPPRRARGGGGGGAFRRAFEEERRSGGAGSSAQAPPAAQAPPREAWGSRTQDWE